MFNSMYLLSEYSFPCRPCCNVSVHFPHTIYYRFVMLYSKVYILSKIFLSCISYLFLDISEAPFFQVLWVVPVPLWTGPRLLFSLLGALCPPLSFNLRLRIVARYIVVSGNFPCSFCPWFRLLRQLQACYP